MGRELRLNNRTAARGSLARLIREFDKLAAKREPTNGEVSAFKALVYGMQTLLTFDKQTEVETLAERMAALEAKLAEFLGDDAAADE